MVGAAASPHLSRTTTLESLLLLLSHSDPPPSLPSPPSCSTPSKREEIPVRSAPWSPADIGRPRLCALRSVRFALLVCLLSLSLSLSLPRNSLLSPRFPPQTFAPPLSLPPPPLHASINAVSDGVVCVCVCVCGLSTSPFPPPFLFPLLFCCLSQIRQNTEKYIIHNQKKKQKI